VLEKLPSTGIGGIYSFTDKGSTAFTEETLSTRLFRFLERHQVYEDALRFPERLSPTSSRLLEECLRRNLIVKEPPTEAVLDSLQADLPSDLWYSLKVYTDLAREKPASVDQIDRALRGLKRYLRGSKTSNRDYFRGIDLDLMDRSSKAILLDSIISDLHRYGLGFEGSYSGDKPQVWLSQTAYARVNLLLNKLFEGEE